MRTCSWTDFCCKCSHWKRSALKSRNKAFSPVQFEITGSYFICVSNRIFAWILPIVLIPLASRGNGLPGYLPAILVELNLFMEGSHKRQVGRRALLGVSVTEKTHLVPPSSMVMDYKIPVLCHFSVSAFVFFLIPLWKKLTLQVEHWQQQFSEGNHLVHVSQAVYPVQVRDRKQTAK